jgi:hypothetical protein
MPTKRTDKENENVQPKPKPPIAKRIPPMHELYNLTSGFALPWPATIACWYHRSWTVALNTQPIRAPRKPVMRTVLMMKRRTSRTWEMETRARVAVERRQKNEPSLSLTEPIDVLEDVNDGADEKEDNAPGWNEKRGRREGMGVW